MQTRTIPATVSMFLLRFAALIAVTVAVLLSVSVSASREAPDAAASAQPVAPVETAQDINSRRYPLQ